MYSDQPKKKQEINSHSDSKGINAKERRILKLTLEKGIRIIIHFFSRFRKRYELSVNEIARKEEK